jgi:hypothetical protein
MAAPKNTPKEIIEKLNEEAARFRVQPKRRMALRDRGHGGFRQ